MDRERAEREEAAWQKRVKEGAATGPYPGRLMTDAEVPEHVRAPAEVFDEQARKEYELATFVLGVWRRAILRVVVVT